VKVGFIGLGHMGSRMATNLVKAGHDVTVFNRTPGKGASLVILGAHEAADLADACNGSAVISMLADDKAASDIALAPAGIVDRLPKGAIHVSMSTLSVAALQATGPGPRKSGTTLCRRPGIRTPGHGGGGKTLHCGRGQFSGR
jgi:3-hydroxyisobutyrate dehydrogenase-like beta-hydroxyacid dehydrogenase